MTVQQLGEVANGVLMVWLFKVGTWRMLRDGWRVGPRRPMPR